MPRKERNHTVRFTEKNRVYLETLGYLDGRNGNKKNEALNLNHLINQALTIVLEGNKYGRTDAVSDAQLAMSLLRLEKRQLARELNVVSARMRAVHARIEQLVETHFPGVSIRMDEDDEDEV